MKFQCFRICIISSALFSFQKINLQSTIVIHNNLSISGIVTQKVENKNEP